jgi:hypothetical protein
LAVLLAAVLLFAGCDAIKGLLGEDSGPDSGGESGGGSGGGSGSGGGVSVVFQDIEVAESGTTTLVTLVFDKDIPGLSDRDVTITDAGDTGAVAGVLSPTEAAGAYTLAVSGVKETGEIAISVGKSGYTFTPATQKAVVNFDEAPNKVTFVNAIANGAAGSQTTTALILTFNAAFATPLQPDDITLWPGSTGAALDGLAPNGDGAYSLLVSGVAAEGEVTVTVVKEGWTVSPAIVSVTVHHQTSPLAGGGEVTLMPVEDDPSQVWEIHTFKAAGTSTLTFSPGISSVTADYLIVAGGGGAGGNKSNNSQAFDFPGGGGAGGLLYQADGALVLENGSVTVKVGTGGAGGQPRTQGENGGLSAIGTIEVPGGGGGGGAISNLDGKPGGSGGGGGSGNNTAIGTGGQRSSTDPSILGKPGGPGGTGGSDSGGSGGGAGGDGVTGLGNGAVVAGGAPWIAADNSAAWVSAVTEGTTDFSRGGDSGGTNAPNGGKPGANYGDGGSAGNNNTSTPVGKGGSGIVVIRFQRPK